jgi:hypothetical protein
MAPKLCCVNSCEAAAHADYSHMQGGGGMYSVMYASSLKMATPDPFHAKSQISLLEAYEAWESDDQARSAVTTELICALVMMPSLVGSICCGAISGSLT